MTSPGSPGGATVPARGSCPAAVTLGAEMPRHDRCWQVVAIFHSHASITASVPLDLSFPSCSSTGLLRLLPCLPLPAPPRRYQRA